MDSLMMKMFLNFYVTLIDLQRFIRNNFYSYAFDIYTLGFSITYKYILNYYFLIIYLNRAFYGEIFY